MQVTQVGLLMLGLGLAVPSTLIMVINIIIKMVSGQNYQFSLHKLGILYIVSLVGWFIAFGIRV